MPSLLLATKNAHKTEEIRALLGPAWTVKDLNAYPEIASPEETGETFDANARIKALAAAARFPGVVLADDSGLEVDALGGAPGVRSARYAGEHATDADNRARLLHELAGSFERTARFRCVLALARGGEIIGTYEGAVEGALLSQERGEGGFGYDPLFVPTGETQTFAELPGTVKNQLSHRGRALAAAGPALQALQAVFVTAREIPATVEQVFAAIRAPERLARWWGPAGFTNTFAVCEFTPGGRWSFTMHGPDGHNYPNENVFAEIEAPVKVVVRHVSEPIFRLTVTLTPAPSGTLVGWEQAFASAEVARRIEHICVPANEQNLDRLTAEVARAAD